MTEKAYLGDSRRERAMSTGVLTCHTEQTAYAIDSICRLLYIWRMVEVIVLEAFEAWYQDLDDSDAEQVAIVVDLLEAKGLSLGFPYSSDVKGAKVGLRELRIQSKGRPLRVLYKFDPKRQAVLILGGDKTGNDRFYAEYVRKAEKLWSEYLAEIDKER